MFPRLKEVVITCCALLTAGVSGSPGFLNLTNCPQWLHCANFTTPVDVTACNCTYTRRQHFNPEKNVTLLWRDPLSQHLINVSGNARHLSVSLGTASLQKALDSGQPFTCELMKNGHILRKLTYTPFLFCQKTVCQADPQPSFNPRTVIPGYALAALLGIVLIAQNRQRFRLHRPRDTQTDETQPKYLVFDSESENLLPPSANPYYQTRPLNDRIDDHSIRRTTDL